MSEPHRARRRATFACQMCRSRRTKCDGRKPACSFCETHDIQCNYVSAAPLPVSRHDEEITAIKERLDHLCGLVSIRLVGQESRIFQDPPGYLPALPPLPEYPLYECVISRHWRDEFPFMTIQTPSMMCLLELNPRLAAQLVAWERTNVSTLSSASGDLDYVFQYEDAIRAFGTFYDRIHHWYPILSPEILIFISKSLLASLTHHQTLVLCSS